MKISKILLNGQQQWIKEDNSQLYAFTGNSPINEHCSFVELKGLSLEALEFINPFWGKNVFGLGYNYKSLVGKKRKYDEPIIFLKSVNSTCANKSKIHYPDTLEKVWVEVELVIIIGKECSRIKPKAAHDYIFGYTIGSDITAENILCRDHHLARSKAVDQFAPIGPWIETHLDTSDLYLLNYINGEKFQSGNTSDMILNALECVSLISQNFTLQPGDIIFTGTPDGAEDSIIKPGDSVIHEIETLGILSFSIV